MAKLQAAFEPSIVGMMKSAQGYLRGAKVPQGPFDAAGAWKQKLVVWNSWLKVRGEDMGLLTLQRTPRPDGEFELHADWHCRQNAGDFQQIRATLICAADDLGTPRSWRVDCRTLLPTERPISDLTTSQEAKVNQGVIELSSGGRRFADEPLKEWTSNWSLLEAVQRLGGKEIKPLAFTMLDFLDLRKDGQTLSNMGTQEVTLGLGGPTAQLRGYQQVGHGILPYEYWLDEHGRLVAMRTSLYGLLAVEEAPTQ